LGSPGLAGWGILCPLSQIRSLLRLHEDSHYDLRGPENPEGRKRPRVWLGIVLVMVDGTQKGSSWKKGKKQLYGLCDVQVLGG
jgi:hypothetical protein